MRILIYQTNLDQIGGIETFLCNFIHALWEYYDITVLYDRGDYKQIRRISPYVEVEKYNRFKEYETDIFIRTSTWKVPTDNIRAKRYIDMCHNNYKYLDDNGVLSQTYQPLPWKCDVVACGEDAAKNYKKAMKQDAIAIENLLSERKKPNKVLHFISFCRLNDEKGINNMVRMVDMLRKANIKFDWKIFSNTNEKILTGEEIQYYKPRFDVVDYVCDADYSVLLSKLEGLPYQILESLQNEKPCIVTDIPGNTEKIKDGINGYVIPVDENGDIKEYDVTKFLNIPKVEEYSNNSAEKWKKFLGGAKYKKKKPKEIEEIQTQRLEVLKTCEYENYGDIIELIPKNHTLMGWIMKGDEILVSEDETIRLIKEGICKIIK